MPRERIEIGRVNHKGNKVTYVVCLLGPEDASAKSGLPPSTIVIQDKMILREPPVLEPNIAAQIGQLLIKAGDTAAERWPAWNDKLVALTSGKF